MEGGVLGVLPGIIGTLQATEAIKFLTEIGEPLIGKLLHYDALLTRFKTFNLRPDPGCAVCGENPTITEPVELEGYCNENKNIPGIEVGELAKIRGEAKTFTLLDVRDAEEVDVCQIDGSTWIPLGEIEGRINELSKNDPLFVVCKSGGRSAKAVSILHSSGFENAVNVEGGIDAWRSKVDPDLPVG